MMYPPSNLQEIPYTPDSTPYFSRVRHLPWPVWLDSAGRGRFDIIAALPITTLVTRDGETRIHHQSGTETTTDQNPLQVLQSFLPDTVTSADIPFCGGAIGYFGYDLGRYFETLPVQSRQAVDLPDMQVGIYAWALIQDHERKISHVVWLPGHKPVAVIDTLLASGADGSSDGNSDSDAGTFCTGEFAAEISWPEYQAAFARIQDYIHQGDCYQVNLTQRFFADFSGDPLAAYLTLRRALPSPFSAFFQPETGAIMSISPERFLRVENRHVLTQPIKGTIRRGATPGEDEALATALCLSLKDRAENLMIVDLLRNDLSRACHDVKTTRLFNLESYANVHHLVSTVEATLNAEQTPLQLLQKSFPGGSITGAPKIRAMQIVEEIEPSRRSVYCGCLGYVGADGRMDTSIAIRTVVYHNHQIHCWGGGGIVADSVAETEYEESLAKIRLIMDTLRN